MKSVLTCAAIAAALLGPGLARAQYVKTESSAAFTPLANGAAVTFPDGQDVDAFVQIGFPFRYYDSTYTYADVSVNGTVHFGTVATHQKTPEALPSVQPPAGIVAPWWDDLARSGTVSTELDGAAPNRTFTIEWKGVAAAADGASPGYALSFQVVLHEGIAGQLDIIYGGQPLSTARLAGSLGFDDPSGTKGLTFAACSPACGPAGWPGDGHEISLSIASGFDLTGNARLSNFNCAGGSDASCTGGTLTADVTLLAQNLGIADAPEVDWSVYLSADGQLSTSTDTLLASGSDTTALGATAGGRAYTLAQVTIPTAFRDGQVHYLISQIHSGTATDTNPADDVVAAPVTMPLPDLTAANVVGPNAAWLGGDITVAFDVTNKGTTPLSGPQVAVFLSDNKSITISDTMIYLSAPFSLAAGATQSFSVTATVPATRPDGSAFVEGPYYLGVFADPFNVTPETNEYNNVALSAAQVTVSAPAPDLVVPLVQAPSNAAAGEAMPVRRVITNEGNRDADVDYDVFLSSNDIISTSDLLIGTGTVHVPAGGLDDGSIQATLPETLTAGSYYVGVIVNPNGTVKELDLTNDVGVSANTVQVAKGTLDLSTTWLPDALVGVPYHQELVAVGGVGNYQFSIVSGSLPAGLQFTPAGAIDGTPTVAGGEIVGFQVASGNETAARSLALRAVDPTTSLAVSTTALPAAYVGQPYHSGVTAVGGVPPYTWPSASGLPPGITLDATGLLSGTPTSVGTASITVHVSDASGNVAQGKLALPVANGTDLSILGVDTGGGTFAAAPPDAYVGATYVADFVATGGRQPYKWTLSSGRLPTGLSLKTTADGKGEITGNPSAAGLHTIDLEVLDGGGLTASSTYVLRSVAERLGLATASLPDTSPGKAYSAKLKSSSADAAARWQLYGGALPPGLALGDDGTISGKVAGGVSPMTFHFAAAVSDSAGGFGYGALSIKVNAAAKKQGCGCGDSGAGLFGLLLLALALAPRLRRRPGFAGLALVAALAAAPGAARAAGPNYNSWIETSPLATLSSPTTLWTSCDYDTALVTLPFTFQFYGTSYTQVYVSCDGNLGFGSANTPSYGTLPITYAPAEAQAMGDDLYAGGVTGSSVTWGVTGTAPNRVFVASWNAVQPYFYQGTTYPAYTFQIQVLENGLVRLVYGVPTTGSAPSMTAGVGIQDSSGAQYVAPLTCNGSCGAADFANLGGKAIVFGQIPDLVPTQVAAPAIVAPGGPVAVPVTVANLGGQAATGVTAELWLSRDRAQSPDDVDLGPLTVGSLGPQQSVTATANVTLPGATTAGSYWVIAVVDPANTVQESNEGNNSLAAPVLVSLPAPNLTVSGVSYSGGPAFDVGSTTTVTATVANPGAVDATTDVTAYLSLNPYISTGDIAVGTVTGVAVAHGASASVQIDVDFSGLQPGTYTVGAIVDPAGQVAESNELDNTGAAASPIQLVGGPVQIATSKLADASVSIPYSARLDAVGGDGAYAWVVNGTLPDGLAFDPVRAVVYGTPTSAGDFTFGAQVSSAGHSANASFTIHVSPTVIPLGVVTTQLPWGVFASPYQARLVASGGTPPYAWSVVGGGALPAGLALAPDGSVEGMPDLTGNFSTDVTVTDSASPPATARGQVAFSVAPPGKVTIVSGDLPDGRLDVAYQGSLQAVGGTLPYAWLVMETRRLPSGPGDAGSDAPCALPDGLTLSPTGELSGRPQRVGDFALVVRAYDARVPEPTCTPGAAPPAGGDTTTVLLHVLPDVPLTIATESLPDGQSGKPYGVKLLANGATGQTALKWALVDAGQAGAQALPPGLTLTDDGNIAGKCTKSGHYDFLVRADDQFGRWDVKPLSIDVKAPAQPSSGCGTGGAGLLALLPLGLLLGRRRRFPAALALALLVGLAGASACSSSDPCKGVKCSGDNVSCDPADGVCKCGGAGGPICGKGQTCDPSGTCTADRCATVVCDGQNVCDPADGQCKCGIAGPVCTANQSCDAIARACAADACAGVACSAGEKCDPADGLCHCGAGAACGPGQLCSDGACTASKCASAACVGGTSCDPADGLCKCGGAGGALCVFGQLCSNGQCVQSSLCQSVACPSGAGCDPADGKCICGSTGAVCGRDQSCDVQAQQCVGGDRCATVTCQGALSCDPESGTCKCGGLGGVECPQGQICANAGNGVKCVSECDPLHQDCPDKTQGCYYEQSSGVPFCELAGTNADGDGCSTSADCIPGYGCWIGAPGAAVGTCVAYCDVAGSGTACKPGTTCSAVASGATLGICHQ